MNKLPTEKQIAFLEDNEINYWENITRQEASELIGEYLEMMRDVAADYDAENYGDR